MHKSVKQFIISILVAIPFLGSTQETITLKNELYIAIENNNLKDVKSIVDDGYDINQVFKLELDYLFHGFIILNLLVNTNI